MRTLVDLLIRLLTGPPDCDECGQYDPRTMHGSYWHLDTCSRTRPAYPDGSDVE